MEPGGGVCSTSSPPTLWINGIDKYNVHPTTTCPLSFVFFSVVATQCPRIGVRINRDWHHASHHHQTRHAIEHDFDDHRQPCRLLEGTLHFSILWMGIRSTCDGYGSYSKEKKKATTTICSTLFQDPGATVTDRICSLFGRYFGHCTLRLGYPSSHETKLVRIRVQIDGTYTRHTTGAVGWGCRRYTYDSVFAHTSVFVS